MLKEVLTSLQEKYTKVKEDQERYQTLLAKVNILPPFYPYTSIAKNKKDLTISPKSLLDMCPDLNEADAIIIRGLIPIDEICLSCLHTTEVKTNIKFYFVATTKYLWLIKKDGYLKYEYQNITVEEVKKGLMSEVLLLGNMLFTVDGLKEALSKFIMLFSPEERTKVIEEALQIFHGSTPKIFYLNDNKTGISIDNNYEIIFHNKEFHHKYRIEDIKNYELLLDDMVVRERKSNRRSRLTSNKSNCYQMILRITTTDQILILPILEKQAFTNIYSQTSEVFIKNKAFADKVIDLLDELDEKHLNHEI